MQDIFSLISQYSFVLTIPILIISAILVFKLISTVLKLVSLIICLLMLALSWMYFIEPRMLMTKEVNIPIGINKNIILVSDPHFGSNKSSNYATQLANEINKTPDVNMVLWAGDWSENMKESDFDSTLAPLALIRYPQYSVLGNHDYIQGSDIKSIEQPTEYSRKLTLALEKVNIRVLSNELIQLGDINLAGLTSIETQFQNTSIFTGASNSPTLTLVHEPYSITKIPDNKSSLTLAGHTHCGQIKIPQITQYLYSQYKKSGPNDIFFDGLYDQGAKGKVFVSCGVGERLFPLRFLNPPTIYKINLN
jgi:uncharacterized protein